MTQSLTVPAQSYGDTVGDRPQRKIA